MPGNLLGGANRARRTANANGQELKFQGIPHAIADKVKAELDKMVQLGVIVEETEPTPS